MFIATWILKLQQAHLTRKAYKRCQLGLEALMFIHYDQKAARISRRQRRQWWRDFVTSPSTFEYCVYQYIKILKQLRGKKLAHQKKGFFKGSKK